MSRSLPVTNTDETLTGAPNTDDVTARASGAPTKRAVDRSSFVWSFAVLIFVLRIVGPNWRGGMPSFFPDSASFLKVARIGPFSPEFWFTERPVGMPLAYWLAGFDVRWLVVGQSFAYAMAAAFVCGTILRLTRSRPVGWFAAIIVGAIVVQPRFALWCIEALSESLGMSASMLALALWLRVAQVPSRHRIQAATVATIAWLLVRDSHGLPVLVIASVMAVVGWRCTDKPLRRTILRSAIALFATFAYVAISQGTSERNQYPLMNNVGLRILPDEDMTASFIDKGMPVSPTLLERAGRNTWDDGEVFLQASELAGFRDWVRGSGQFDQLTSLVTDAGFWLDVMQHELPGALGYDFGDYDRFDVGDRLPSRFAWFSGIDSPATLWWFVALAVAGVALIANRSRLLALILGTGLVASLVELYASIATDAVEVQRHTIGPMLRINLLCVVTVLLALDGLVRRASVERTRTRDSWLPMSAPTAVILGTIGWFAIENRSQDYDPQYARTIVERAARFGGTYYENGIHNKGPIETFLYDLARLPTSYDTYWFAIAFFALAISVLLGVAARTTSRIFGATPTAMALAATVTTVHFFMSSSDYAGVVYSRNITTALLALVFVTTLWDRAWTDVRHAKLAWIGSFVILGLAVQTLLTTLFAAVAVAGLLLTLRRGSSHLVRPSFAGAMAFGLSLASAPFWYALRGRFDEFWSGWWTYASFMSDGTGRGYMEQLGLGWNTMVDHYQDRPESLLIVLAFVVLGFLRRTGSSPTQRAVMIALVAWFAGGWIELILGQRYSSHYFSVIAVPTALMLASLIALLSPALAVAGRWCAEPRSKDDRRTSHAPVMLAAALVIVTQGSSLFWDGATRAGRFQSFAAESDRRESALDGQGRTVRAILDLVSEDGDAVLAWTMYPWTYLNNERVPATRLSWKSFMVGEIYLGRTSKEYVLPRTWNWFAADIEESNPAAYLRPKETTLDESTPFADYVNDEFTAVFDGATIELRVRESIWTRLTAPNADDEPASAPFVDEIGCFRWRGTLEGLDASQPFGFTFEDVDGSAEIVHLSIDSERAWSSSDNVEFASTPRTSTEATITLLVGPRAAVLIEDGAVLAAVRLDGTVRTSVFAPEGFMVADGNRSALTDLPGCINS